MSRTTMTTLVMLAALTMGGCVAVAAGAATYGAMSYAGNEAFRDYEASMDATWTATLEALQAQGYPADPGAIHGASEGRIKAGNAFVRVEKVSNLVTRVRVRIGTFESDDHRRQALLLLQAVSDRLGG